LKVSIIRPCQQVMRVRFEVPCPVLRSQMGNGLTRLGNCAKSFGKTSIALFESCELEFETRLAVAELKNRSGQSVAARAESLTLENAARKNGFGLIASKALSFRNARE
jgi:hypothetical protein